MAMGTWIGERMQKMHRRAASVVTCGHPVGGVPYPHRLEKVKFGVTLDEVCKPDIPGPLLVLILKLNKEAPLRKGTKLFPFTHSFSANDNNFVWNLFDYYLFLFDNFRCVQSSWSSR